MITCTYTVCFITVLQQKIIISCLKNDNTFPITIILLLFPLCTFFQPFQHFLLPIILLILFFLFSILLFVIVLIKFFLLFILPFFLFFLISTIRILSHEWISVIIIVSLLSQKITIGATMQIAYTLAWFYSHGNIVYVHNNNWFTELNEYFGNTCAWLMIPSLLSFTSCFSSFTSSLLESRSEWSIKFMWD